MSRYRKVALLETLSIVLALWLGLSLTGLSHATSNHVKSETTNPPQSAPLSLKVAGVSIERDRRNDVTINGKPAIQTENGPDAVIYVQDRYSAIFYKHNGQVELTQDGAFVGWAR